MPPPPPFMFDIAISSWCAGCKLDRAPPATSELVLRDIGTGAMVLTGDPCSRCGRTGVVVQAGARQQE